jgi:hypothetical protein
MALTGHIKIEKELALRWYRRAYGITALFTHGYYYAVRLLILWLIIAIADSIGGQRDLAPLHGLTLFLVWIAITSYEYYRWYRGLEKTVVGWEFDATLDEQGVKTDAQVETAREVAWSFYTGYREYDDHLDIYEKDQVTFIPKTDELAGLIAFTKEKIRPL